ncbi:D-amino-acid oxidase, partial [Acinetobacter baumannii]
IPVIGQHPAFQSVYLAVGHEGLGVTTATGTAKLIAMCHHLTEPDFLQYE